MDKKEGTKEEFEFIQTTSKFHILLLNLDLNV